SGELGGAHTAHATVDEYAGCSFGNHRGKRRASGFQRPHAGVGRAISVERNRPGGRPYGGPADEDFHWRNRLDDELASTMMPGSGHGDLRYNVTLGAVFFW